MLAALDAVPPGVWSLPSSYRATGAHHGYRRVTVDGLEPFRFVLDGFAPVHNAWLSWIDPGGFIVAHVDAGPYRERWQVPIIPGDISGDLCVAGVPFRVAHWEPHWVCNRHGDRPRVHLVIDRDVIVDPAPAPFRICEEQPYGPQ